MQGRGSTASGAQGRESEPLPVSRTLGGEVEIRSQDNFRAL